MSASKVDLDELAALEEQRDFLLRSLDDLDREHQAGDLDDDDYRTLHDDYTVRAADVLRAIDAHHALLDESRRPANWRRVAAWVCGVALLGLLGGWSVAHFSGAKDTSKTAAGAPVDRCISLTQQMLMGPSGSSSGSSADSAARSGPVEALRCYHDVLAKDPTNVSALTYQGWTWALLARQLGGSVAQADIDRFVLQATISLQQALKENPRFADALVFSAINANWQGDKARARGFLARFDALKLPATNQMSQLVDGLLRPQLEGATSSTTVPATSTTATSATTSTTVN